MTTTVRVAPPERDRAVTLFHALSDETRLAILEQLRGGECCVCDLQDAMDAARVGDREVRTGNATLPWLAEQVTQPAV